MKETKAQRRKNIIPKNNNGITLIALVITIIVMLILVAVTISMAVNGGLFGYAGKAAGETKNELNKEQQIANRGIEVDGKWYNSIDEYLNKDKEQTPPAETISKEKSYVGCYADVDGNGTVDGVIYADLAIGGNGIWNPSGYDTEPSYSYEAVAASELKDYYVSGTADGDFGNGVEVLTATGEGKDRFYVMALEDLTTPEYTTFYWYYNAAGKISDYETATSTEFGTGKANTAKIKGYWDTQTYGEQNPRDLWAQIDITSGWFLPSYEEWVAFLSVFNVSYDDYDFTTYPSCHKEFRIKRRLLYFFTL